ncbi:MAG: antitoxin family protein [Chloroflexi bacterium]|nr:antitoxin family protein [Chloroflexota bacterium]
METVTVRAVYKKGVLKPVRKLNLPENTVVEVRVSSVRPSQKSPSFASLIGIWEHLPEKEKTALEKKLTHTRRRSAAKVKNLAKKLK